MVSSSVAVLPGDHDDGGPQAEGGRRVEEEGEPVERGAVALGDVPGDAGVAGLVDEDVVRRRQRDQPGRQGHHGRPATTGGRATASRPAARHRARRSERRPVAGPSRRARPGGRSGSMAGFRGTRVSNSSPSPGVALAATVRRPYQRGDPRWPATPDRSAGPPRTSPVRRRSPLARDRPGAGPTRAVSRVGVPQEDHQLAGHQHAPVGAPEAGAARHWGAGRPGIRTTVARSVIVRRLFGECARRPASARAWTAPGRPCRPR